MRKILFTVLLTICSLSFVETAAAGETAPVPVDVLYMNHGPLRPTIQRLQEIFSRFEGKITAAWHDFDTKEGQDFMRSRGVTTHVPCIVWINGSHTFVIDGKEVSFIGFPTGSGPAQFQGKWTYEDVEKVLQSVTKP